MGSYSLYGAAEAAQAYFGKRIDEINLAQAATLAALLNGPGLYTGSDARQGALDRRRRRVLELMRQDHPDRYSADDIRKAETEPVQMGVGQETPRFAAYFVSDVIQQEVPRT